MLVLAHEVLPDDIQVDSFGWALLASILIAAVGMVLQMIVGTNDDDEYTLRVTRRIARRGGGGDAHRRPRHHLPRDRRPRPPGAPRRHARRKRSEHGPLGRRGRLPARRVGDGPVVADRRQPGRDPARLQRGHPRVPLGGEGDGADRDLLLAVGLRGDRGTPGDRDRPPAQRRGQSRQPALRRGGRDDPDGQPDRRREAREPGLPRVPGQRLQRHAHARPVLLGGRAGDRGLDPRRAARRAAPRTPRRQVPVPARGPVRVRARPHRLRRAQRHDARASGRVRDVLQLRRGRPSLRPGAGGHDGGAAQARPAVRPHRARAAVRGAPLRDRRPLRPRADAGRDVQAAPRLRPGRARGAVAERRSGRLRRRWRRAGRARRPGGRRGDGALHGEAGEERGRRPGGRGPGIGEPGPRLPHGVRPPDDHGGDRGAASPPAGGAAHARPHRLAPRALRGARRGRPRPSRHPLPERRPRRGRRPADAPLTDGGVAPASHRRLPARGRHHDRRPSTTRPWTRAARSRSSSASTAAWAGRRRGPSSSCRPRSSPRPSRSSGPRPCTACSPAGARRCRTPISSGRARRARAPG